MADYNPSSRVLGHLPEPMRRVIRVVQHSPQLLGDYFSDFRQFLRHSSSAGYTNHDQVLSRITATYHNIEKGLSLPNPRLGFGAANLRLLLDMMRTADLDVNAEPVQSARNVLKAYVAFHAERDFTDIPYRAEILQIVDNIDPQQPIVSGGLRTVTRQDIVDATAAVGDTFFTERHSIRQFSDQPVDAATLIHAIKLAQKAPAVCNRQAGYVYIVQDAEMKRKLLDFQGGSRGFTDQIDSLLVVTTRLSNFWAAGERNQPWIDGGLFSMALIYALHAQGLGSVALNWSKRAKDSRKLREMLNMGDDQVTMMMIGVGHLRDTFTVPVSNRRDVAFSHRLI